MELILDFCLFAFLTVTAVLMLRLRSLFAVAMLSGIFSLLSAALFTLMDAVDVAFTESAVGAGMSTLLFLGTLALTGAKTKAVTTWNIPALAAVLVTGGLLMWGTLDMPFYGDAEAPIHHHVADRYVEASGDEVGPPNIVTSVLASYRGFDTLGETTVIFTAGMSVLLLIGAPFLGRRKGGDQ
ncbi:DUF4040 domain-containing protein [Pararhodospirillum photometricum]|nr:DUF4040 domain-containing protein [Pararhodospirillum photometricum]